jgi:hypothetical protein
VSRISLRSIIVVLACAAACARMSTEESPPPPHEQAPHDAMFGQNHEAKVLEPAPKISDEAKAYLADCHHTFEKQEEEGDRMIEECLWREFDQNCAPDPSGCWDKGQECRDACGKPCASCDEKCGGGCDGCMGKCAAEDDACKAECAEARVDCRDKCLDARDKCANADCSKAEEKCNADHLALREQKCPRCDEINACMNAAIEKNKEPTEACAKKFKREPAECMEWCFEY